MKRIFYTLILLLIGVTANAQNTVTGTFPALSKQLVKLVGFDGFNTHAIDSIVANDKGIFNLSFGENDDGMGYLVSPDNKSVIVILNNEDIILKGESFALPETIEVLKSKQNQILEQYATEHPLRKQALSAWDYLSKMYKQDSLFATYKVPQQAIEKEKKRIKAEDSLFVATLDQATYVSWFLPIRKLLSSVSTVAQYRPQEIPATIKAFRALDYTKERLYKSGLLQDIIDSHFWLLENSGHSSDLMYVEMNISIDSMIENLSKDEKKFNKVTKYLFDLLERRSLFQASEYLAIKVLTQNSCTVNDDLAKQLEFYRIMKKGNTAADIIFSGDVFKNGSQIKTPKRLSDIKSAYKVVVFGASWCAKCAEELSELLPLYKKWKSKGVEVVFVSLDTDKTKFNNFSSIFPFFSMCDYKKWDTQAAKDYYVFASPTLFLLDKNQKIILRPNSVKQLDTWVDYAIGEGKE
ncbi:MAG: thiol-disulfide isomerase/thioredoxin [Psychroserpens sp.]|jgi:thiol-disulfide isomerase/thioredoxin